MNCTEVREALAERALSALPPEEAAQVDRHLEWCAGCRKEAAELQQAAATFGLALPPADPPASLRDRVVRATLAVAGKPGTRRRARSAVASIIAALMAVAGLGWGSLMTGRADRLRNQAEAARQQLQHQVEVTQKWQRLIETLPGRSSEDAVLTGQLAPPPEQLGGGAALVYLSPNILDWAMVQVSGLSGSRDVLPYRVYLARSDGTLLRIGKIKDVSRGSGSGDVFKQFDQDLTGFTAVIVRDASGSEVLRGVVRLNAGFGTS